MRLNESLVKYLAGLLDADGSLSLTFRSYPPGTDRYCVALSMRLTASDAVDHGRFVESLPSLTGLGSTIRYGKEKQFAVWIVSKRSDLEMLLPRIIKHMVVKAQHWQWLLDLWRESRRSVTGLKQWGDGWNCSESERAHLTAASKESRRTRVGPIKPKNHPTWAWLAGYLDGDGWYRRKHYKCGTYTRRDAAEPTQYHQWLMVVGAVAHESDASVLRFIQNAFGGHIRPHGRATPHLLCWSRNLGPMDRSFALRFLPNLAKHSRLKRHKIDQIIHHHRQRLSAPSPTG
jgi:hypothetical protein